jgi:hypothetical protein
MAGDNCAAGQSLLMYCLQVVLLPLLIDIASGLEFLHGRSIMHGGGWVGACCSCACSQMVHRCSKCFLNQPSNLQPLETTASENSSIIPGQHRPGYLQCLSKGTAHCYMSTQPEVGGQQLLVLQATCTAPKD